MSNFDQRVTQDVLGVLRPRQRVELSQESVTVLDSPETANVQAVVADRGTEPAWSTGHFSVRYWPGGERRVVARLEHLLLRLRPEHRLYSKRRHAQRIPSAVVRPGVRACGGGVPRPDGLERRRRPRSGESCQALLLTPKARVIAPSSCPAPPRRLPAPDRAGARRTRPRRSRAGLLRDQGRDRAEEHTSHVVFGGDGIATADYGEPAAEVLDAGLELASRPRSWSCSGSEPERPPGAARSTTVLPAEAGLTERAVSFTKGCYPGQEPIARLHYRGHANRGLRVLSLQEPPDRDRDRLRGEERRPDHERGRRRRRRRRTRVRPSRGAGRRRANGRHARRYTDRSPAPVAQGIERCPAEAEVACSNHAGRTSWTLRFSTRARRPLPRDSSACSPTTSTSRSSPRSCSERRRRRDRGRERARCGLDRALARAAEQRRPRGAGAGVAGRPRGAPSAARRPGASRSDRRAGGHPPQLRRRDRSRAGYRHARPVAAPPARYVTARFAGPRVPRGGGERPTGEIRDDYAMPGRHRRREAARVSAGIYRRAPEAADLRHAG